MLKRFHGNQVLAVTWFVRLSGRTSLSLWRRILQYYCQQANRADSSCNASDLFINTALLCGSVGCCCVWFFLFFSPPSFCSVLLLSVFCRLSSPVQSTVVSFGQERNGSWTVRSACWIVPYVPVNVMIHFWRRKSDCVRGETRLCGDLLAALKDGSVFHWLRNKLWWWGRWNVCIQKASLASYSFCG